MGKCDDLRIRTKKYCKYLYCKERKQEVTFEQCRNCSCKDYKQKIQVTITKTISIRNKKPIKRSTKPIKQKSNRLKKLESIKFSILTDDLDNCYFCGKPKQHNHETLRGANRQASIKFGLRVPVCGICHDKETKVKNIELEKLSQTRFEEVYPELSFTQYFIKNRK